jgi:hypothetical protein
MTLIINDFDAPKDFKIPISLRRSVIVVYIESSTKIVDTNAPKPTRTRRTKFSAGIRSCWSITKSRVKFILFPGITSSMRRATTSASSPSLILTKIYVHLFSACSASCIAASDIFMREPEGGAKTPTILYGFPKSSMVSSILYLSSAIFRSSKITSSKASAARPLTIFISFICANGSHSTPSICSIPQRAFLFGVM